MLFGDSGVKNCVISSSRSFSGMSATSMNDVELVLRRGDGVVGCVMLEPDVFVV